MQYVVLDLPGGNIVQCLELKKPNFVPNPLNALFDFFTSLIIPTTMDLVITLTTLLAICAILL